MDLSGSIYAISAIIVLASICPFCAFLGYLTPSLIDEYAAGHPAVAGRAYALNVLGCILGPLVRLLYFAALDQRAIRHHFSQPALFLVFFPFAGNP